MYRTSWFRINDTKRSISGGHVVEMIITLHDKPSDAPRVAHTQMSHHEVYYASLFWMARMIVSFIAFWRLLLQDNCTHEVKTKTTMNIIGTPEFTRVNKKIEIFQNPVLAKVKHFKIVLKFYKWHYLPIQLSRITKAHIINRINYKIIIKH